MCRVPNVVTREHCISAACMFSTVWFANENPQTRKIMPSTVTKVNSLEAESRQS